MVPYELPKLSEVMPARKVVGLGALWCPMVPYELPKLSEVRVARKVVGLGALWGPLGALWKICLSSLSSANHWKICLSSFSLANQENLLKLLLKLS